ncbi:cytochrome P450 [Lentzea tibetensis]|uniref:Cytochrome P450 n=1 Tax=Lentzea tibetensis TaxID=2591470 RepID=A0A563EQC8_9PSEU|nr:cytochrome P450 [Lentzea tibetensis]TWP49939.1 cytochrome P450 [Lentzea tibetensis]
MDGAVLGAGFIRDPHPTYARLRADAPVFPTLTPNGMKIWVVTRHDDARDVLSDPRLSKSVRDAMHLLDPDTAEARNFAALPGPLRDNLLSVDGPDHLRLRRLVSRACTVRQVESLCPGIERIVGSLLDGMEGYDVVDLVSAFAAQLPVKVICALLGVPEEDSPALLEWTQTMVSLSFAPVERVAAHSRALHDHIAGLVMTKRVAPGADLISSLIHLRDTEDELTEDELISLIAVMIIGGFETTSNLIGNAVLALLQNPEQLRILRHDPDLVRGAVDELIRFDGSVHTSTFRYTTEPVEVAGVTIPAGAVVFVSLLSANRDESAFEHAGQLDVTRDARAHLGFGHGVHYCIGAALARIETEVALRELITRCPNLRLAVPAEELRWRMSLLSRGLEALPLRTNAERDVSRFYDVYSHVLLKIWDDNFHYGYWVSDTDDSSNRIAAQRLTDLMISLVDVSADDRVLDLGCGVGVPALALADATGAEVVGISINQAQVDEANRRAGGRASFVCADALALPFPDAHFDAAWAFESLLHMDRPKALTELARVVRPGGLVVVADIIQRGPLSQESEAALGPALETFALTPVPTIEDYRVLLTEAGLEPVELRDISEHTKKTMERLAAGATEHHDELVERFGDEAKAYLDVVRSPIAALPEWGYLVAIARRT